MDAVAGWMLRRASHFTTNHRPRPPVGRTAGHISRGAPEVRGRAARMVFEHEPEHDWIVEESGGETMP